MMSTSCHAVKTSLPTNKQKIEFAKLINRLKSLKRTGWLYKKIPNAETVASHTWRVAMLCFLLKDLESINVSKCIEMALLHDMAESVIGDLTPRDKITAEEKSAKEKKAVIQILNLLGFEENSTEEDSAACLMYKLIEEYEKRETLEAKLVKDMDLFDMILQAEEYETLDENLNLQEFFNSGAKNNFLTDYGKDIASQLLHDRQERLKEKEETITDNTEKSQVELTRKDQDFIKDYAASSHLSSIDIENIVRALRKIEN